MQGMHKGPAIFDTTMPQELPTATNQQVLTWASDAEIAEKAGQLQKAEQLYKKILGFYDTTRSQNTIATLAHRDLARVLMEQESLKKQKLYVILGGGIVEDIACSVTQKQCRQRDP